MGKMGIDVSEKRLTELMNQYDVDQGGEYMCGLFGCVVGETERDVAM